MDSKTLIFNRVLINLGIAAKIQHYNDKNPEAATINDIYDSARDFVLKDFDWSFAMKYAELSLAQNSDFVNNSTYLYCYHYPSDCISARSLYLKGSKEEKKFQLACDDNGQIIILTDVCPAVLRYTKRVDNEVLFSSEFITALTYYIASIVAEALTGSAQKADRMLQRYSLFKRRAEQLNANEGRSDDEDNSTYIDSRF